MFKIKMESINNLSEIDEYEENIQKIKKKSWTLKEKINILDEIEANKIRVCKKYNIDERIIRKWRQHEKKIRAAMDINSDNKYCRRIRQKTLTSLLNERVYAWFQKNAKQGITITDSMIQKQALEINRELSGKKDFTASDGWLSKWKKEYNIPYLIYARNYNEESNYKGKDELEISNQERNYEQNNEEIEIDEMKPFFTDVEVTKYEAINSLDKLIKHLEFNRTATDVEMTVLMKLKLKLKLKQKAQEINDYRRSGTSPEFFACK